MNTKDENVHNISINDHIKDTSDCAWGYKQDLHQGMMHACLHNIYDGALKYSWMYIHNAYSCVSSDRLTIFWDVHET